MVWRWYTGVYRGFWFCLKLHGPLTPSSHEKSLRKLVCPLTEWGCSQSKEISRFLLISRTSHIFCWQTGWRGELEIWPISSVEVYLTENVNRSDFELTSQFFTLLNAASSRFAVASCKHNLSWRLDSMAEASVQDTEEKWVKSPSGIICVGYTRLSET